MKKLVILSILALTACTKKPNITITTNPYEPWLLDDNCQLSAQISDINLTITDVYKNNIRILVQSKKPLQEIPTFSIYGAHDNDFYLQGFNNTYSIEIPTSMVDQANMHLNKVFFAVKYLPADSSIYKNAIFNLNKLPKALLSIRQCR